MRFLRLHIFRAAFCHIVIVILCTRKQNSFLNWYASKVFFHQPMFQCSSAVPFEGRLDDHRTLLAFRTDWPCSLSPAGIRGASWNCRFETGCHFLTLSNKAIRLINECLARVCKLPKCTSARTRKKICRN